MFESRIAQIKGGFQPPFFYYKELTYKSISLSEIISVVATRIFLSSSFKPPMILFSFNFARVLSESATSITNSLKKFLFNVLTPFANNFSDNLCACFADKKP